MLKGIGGPALVAVACVAIASAEVVVRFDFDAGLQGWSLVDPSQGTLTWSAAGGNPLGFARFVDGDFGGGFMNAPDSFLGDWSWMNGHATLRWDHKVIDFGGAGGTAVPHEAWLVGPGGSALFTMAEPAPNGAWLTVSAPILESEWTMQSGDWSALLSNVSELRIRIELMAAPLPDINGIDNIEVVVDCSVPGDLTLDGVVDDQDVLALFSCLNGPDAPSDSSCVCGDTDLDADIDLIDFAVFQSVFNNGV